MCVTCVSHTRTHIHTHVCLSVPPLVYFDRYINNPKFGNYIDDIYPTELEIKYTTDADHQASYLDLDLSYDRDERLQVKLYD